MSQPQRTRIVVISMRDSIERRAAFLDRAKNAAVSWTFFDGLSGVVPGLVYDDSRARVLLGRSLGRGEIGCYASHYTLWTQLLRDDADQYVVLEDDVIVNWKFLEKLAQVDFGQSGIDYLRLYCLRPGRLSVRRYRYLENRHLIALRDPAYGTQGYVITRAGARRLVESCGRIVRPIDSQLDRYWEHGLPNLALFPFPIIDEFAGSTIGDHRVRAANEPARARIERKLRSAWDRVRRMAWLLTRSHRQVRDPCRFAAPLAEHAAGE
ncbi:glycosyltransferase family 25 protein [Sphingomonas segetis]|uniref:glycosyltransferase family 25 protein n=1 Tax=Sphingomonas segetis TaxID=1104779 RepID=UPI0018AD4B07|nr:glycosyltransferase family 25 protein [Sphingomonas segetis]